MKEYKGIYRAYYVTDTRGNYYAVQELALGMVRVTNKFGDTIIMSIGELFIAMCTIQH